MFVCGLYWLSLFTADACAQSNATSHCNVTLQGAAAELLNTSIVNDSDVSRARDWINDTCLSGTNSPTSQSAAEEYWK